jgi:agmatinase
MPPTPSDFDPDAPARRGAGIFGLPHTPDEAAVVLIPVPWEATTSYGSGASRAPAAILGASRQVDLHDLETGRPWSEGIALLEEDASLRDMNDDAKAAAGRIIDAGGVRGIDEDDRELIGALDRVNRIGDFVNRWLRRETDKWLAAGKLVGVVGGDHSAAFGAIEATCERHPGLGILHLDAHADLRRAYEGFTWSHASIMYNVTTRLPGVARLVQVGVRDVGAAEVAMIESSGGRIVAHFDPDLAARRLGGETWAAQCARIVAPLPPDVYLSFDIDGLDPALCPHTGTPVPGGLSFAEACYLLRAVVESGRRVVGFDLDEVVPGPDGDEWDANVGARLLYKMIGWALKSRH